MVRLIRFLLRQLFILFQQSVNGLLYALPSIFGLLLETAGASLKIAWDALIIALKNVTASADRTSDEWTRHAISAGFPYLWETQLKTVFYGIAVVNPVGVWILIVFAIAFMGRLLF